LITETVENVLIVGSGLTAPYASAWNLTNWLVVALHHGWQVVGDRWDVFLHCHDAPDEMKPVKTRPDQLIINTLHEFIYPDLEQFRELKERNGWMKTMFLTGMWWVLQNIRPKKIGVIGCDMHYPGGDKNCFYGTGTCDPLLHDPKDMQRWLGFLDGYCYAKKIEVVNFSDGPTVLPFTKEKFKNE